MPTYLLRRIGKNTLAKMNSKDFEMEFLNGQLEAANIAKSMMDMTVSSWASKPKFHITVFVNEVNIGTDDRIWNYLDNGTNVRYAIMSNPFTPKTHAHFIGSGSGQGQVVRRGRSVSPPRPGIAAREWMGDISKIMKPEYSRIMKNAVARITARLMHGA
jgi:hypothetical protein